MACSNAVEILGNHDDMYSTSPSTVSLCFVKGCLARFVRSMDVGPRPDQHLA
eukprot:CAMPEP_0175892106 /NCGR_PEP_ID=MMETSP0107_2-20121207/48740_1 /TAXON_ID=195067 ORGANISM="Goniomonas pacifica, Strain CCMP1869" /NCGR_SAMPLE_ID=MMETSP0107_2 /ASSEMBLY_ACC=CAM_ASM_000203 /LENGTH=51 /DNA_ID=CAMNT_0017213027 /DNA_START=270 /DNA_END=421 /DNA_ORIENTATION=+